MGFSWEREIAHIFEIVDGIDFMYAYDIFKGNAFVAHISAPFVEEEPIVQIYCPI